MPEGGKGGRKAARVQPGSGSGFRGSLLWVHNRVWGLGSRVWVSEFGV